MNPGADAAEQIVRISLNGLEVAAKISGEAAKNVALILLSALKDEQKTKGRSRLTKMIRSGKELKVFSIQQRDLAMFTKYAKKYGVLYSVLREKKSQNPLTPVDIIARSGDEGKIQRILDRFSLANVDREAIVSGARKDIEHRKSTQEISENPSQPRNISAYPSEKNLSEEKGPFSEERKRPSVRKKLRGYTLQREGNLQSDIQSRSVYPKRRGRKENSL